MQITSQLNGLEKTLGNLAGMKAKIRAAEILGITRVCVRIRDKAVGYTEAGHPEHPNVQTGRLKASLRYQIEEGSQVKGYVGSDADYAPFVEFGHSQEPGRYVPAIGARLVADSVQPYPFLRPAMDDVVDGKEGEKLYGGAFKEKLGL